MAEGQTKFNKDFFDKVEPIKLKDPLAFVLGAIDRNEAFVFKYADAVKLAGHSCPAVSGAYKLTQIALKKLYGKETPIRGEIEVKMKGGVDYKANGPISQVISFITGACGETGFHGLGGGMYSRHNLLTFDEENLPDDPKSVCSVVFQKAGTPKSVEVTYSNYMLPTDPRMGDLMPLAVRGTGTDEQIKEFGTLWHERVRKVLLDPPDGMFVVKDLS